MCSRLWVTHPRIALLTPHGLAGYCCVVEAQIYRVEGLLAAILAIDTEVPALSFFLPFSSTGTHWHFAILVLGALQALDRCPGFSQFQHFHNSNNSMVFNQHLQSPCQGWSPWWRKPVLRVCNPEDWQFSRPQFRNFGLPVEAVYESNILCLAL